MFKGYIAEAKNWLDLARKTKNDNENCVRWVREYLAKAGVKLDFIGTSEKELAELLVQGYLAEAKKWLGFARKSKGCKEDCIRWVRDSLAKAGAKPEDIGTSEEEFASLLNKAA